MFCQSALSSADYVKVSIIGTYHSVFGDAHDVFKRGVDTFPQIESKCYCVSSVNLQNFMNVLSRNIDSDKRLKIGSFMMDASADAVLDGNRFFQRHAAILGSTGSGKSWCIANVLEKASALQHANIIVFDMHGEYEKLASGYHPIADRYRIAGPGDLENPSANILFLPYWLLNRDELLSIVVNKIVEMLTEENIQQIASQLAEIDEQQKDKTNLLRLNRLIRENQNATANLLKALERGIAEDTILIQLEKRQAEKKALDEELQLEKYKTTSISADEYAFFLNRMVKNSSHDLAWRRALIDVFINKIFIYEDDEGKPKKLTILCNTQDGQMDVSLEDLKTSGSSKGRLVRPTGFEPAAFRVGVPRHTTPNGAVKPFFVCCAQR